MTKLLICLVLAFWLTPHVSSFLFDPNNKIELHGSYGGANLGTAVSAGDINGDGFSDIMVVGRLPENNITCGLKDYCSGIVYILYGSKTNLFQVNLTNISASQGFTVTAKTQNKLDLSVSTAGDVNGDGIDDIVIGDPNEYSESGLISRLTTYVIFGKRGNRPNINLNNTLSPTEGYRIFAILGSEFLGSAVNFAGDVNGDGIDDIILGAFEAFDSRGAAYIIYGSKTPSDIDLMYLNRTQGITIKGEDPQDYLGFAVSRAGDVNNDGFDDVVIGADGYGPGYNYETGAVYVIFGGENLSDVDTSHLHPSEGIIIKGQTKIDSLGWSVSAAGDVNGDGVDDIIIGANTASPTNIRGAGDAYVIFGKKNFTHIDLHKDFEDFKVPNPKTGFRIIGLEQAELGYAVAGVGDVNGDGIDDVLVAADKNFQKAGSVYVIFGSRNECFGIDTSKLNSNQGVLIKGDNPNDLFGSSVANAGDVNGDGVNDLIVGAVGVGNESAGAVYVILSQVGSDIITE